MVKQPRISVTLQSLSKVDQTRAQDAITLALEAIGFTVATDKLQLKVTKKRAKPVKPQEVEVTTPAYSLGKLYPREQTSKYADVQRINDITPYCTYRWGCRCASCSFSTGR